MLQPPPILPVLSFLSLAPSTVHCPQLTQSRLIGTAVAVAGRRTYATHSRGASSLATTIITSWTAQRFWKSGSPSSAARWPWTTPSHLGPRCALRDQTPHPVLRDGLGHWVVDQQDLVAVLGHQGSAQAAALSCCTQLLFGELQALQRKGEGWAGEVVVALQCTGCRPRPPRVVAPWSDAGPASRG